MRTGRSTEKNSLREIFQEVKNDGLVKSRIFSIFVIPAKAGIQLFQVVLDSCFRRRDVFSDFLRFHQK